MVARSGIGLDLFLLAACGAKHRASGEADDIGLCIETRLTMDGEEATFGGHLVMLPNQGALGSLLDTLQV